MPNKTPGLSGEDVKPEEPKALKAQKPRELRIRKIEVVLGNNVAK
jgi:hypothetical protein